MPVVAGVVTYKLCKELRAREVRPLRGWQGRTVVRREDGGFDSVPADDAANPKDGAEPGMKQL